MPSIEDAIMRVRDLPSLPAVVAELLSSMEQDDIDSHVLAAKITLDQSLTARTLRLANSSFYGMQSKVTTIQQAIAVLGLHSIRTLVTACSVTASFPAGSTGAGFDLPSFWRHSAATAVCAKALAPHLRLNPDTAFTAALLHDLGTLVLATRYPAEYQAMADYQRQQDCFLIEAERAVFGFDHAAVGSALAAHWKFPPKIQEAVAGHHVPPDGPPSLALAIHLANTVAHGLALSGQEQELAPPVSAQAWRAAALSDEAWLAVFGETERMYRDMCQILVN